MPSIVPPAPATQVSQPHILLVEDQERAAHGLQELLVAPGLPRDVRGRRAGRPRGGPRHRLRRDRAGRPPPGMDGFEVCRALRQDAATRQVPVIMLTGLADTPSKLQGFDTGADDYLVKPVPARELAARLRKLIASRLDTATQIHRPAGPRDRRDRRRDRRGDQRPARRGARHPRPRDAAPRRLGRPPPRPHAMPHAPVGDRDDHLPARGPRRRPGRPPATLIE